MAKSATRKTPTKAPKLGALPEWDLKDLYSGLYSPEIKRDLDRADSECVAFEQAFKGRLQAMAADEGAGAALAQAVKRYEALDDSLGRLISYASLLYAGNTTDPTRANPDTVMPPFGRHQILDAAEIERLVEFLHALP